LEKKHSTKMRCGWKAAACALMLGCWCISSGHAFAQADAANNSAAQTATSKPRPTSISHASTTSAAKSTGGQTASHRATTHSKSSTANAAHTNSKSAGSRSAAKSGRKTGKRKTAARGQQKIDHERAQEIQEALVREHYLNGEATGTWDDASEAAMRRYQAAHGWQSKSVPDARALISLGLGPSHDHLLNPESAMTTEPAPHAASLSPVSHSADPGAPLNAAPATPANPASAPSADRDPPTPQ
jgi:hypothetical protein